MFILSFISETKIYYSNDLKIIKIIKIQAAAAVEEEDSMFTINLSIN